MPEVILLQDVESLGTKGAVVDVSKGYLRNFLVPRKLAQPATKAGLAHAAQLAASAEQRQGAGARHLAGRRRAARQHGPDDRPPGRRGRTTLRFGHEPGRRRGDQGGARSRRRPPQDQPRGADQARRHLQDRPRARGRRRGLRQDDGRRAVAPADALTTLLARAPNRAPVVVLGRADAGPIQGAARRRTHGARTPSRPLAQARQRTSRSCGMFRPRRRDALLLSSTDDDARRSHRRSPFRGAVGRRAGHRPAALGRRRAGGARGDPALREGALRLHRRGGADARGLLRPPSPADLRGDAHAVRGRRAARRAERRRAAQGQSAS